MALSIRWKHPGEAAALEGPAKEIAKIKLAVDHLKSIARAYLEFMRYTYEMNDKDAKMRARELGIRRGNFHEELSYASRANSTIRRPGGSDKAD